MVHGDASTTAHESNGDTNGVIVVVGPHDHDDGTASVAKTDRSTTTTTTRKRKSVHIAEDRNETAVMIRTAPTSDSFRMSRSSVISGVSSESLLAQAEQKLSGQQQRMVALTVAGAKAATATLEKAMETNALQRAKAGGQPELYMESEVALYEQIAALKAFAAADDLTAIYPALHDATNDLIQLLVHDNVDIAIAVTSVFLEWLDLDLATRAALSTTDNANEPASLSPINMAVVQLASIVVSDGAELLVDNFSRLATMTNGATDDDEDMDDEVGRGIDDVLSLLENLLEMDNLMLATEQRPIMANNLSIAAVLCRSTRLVSWILTQLQSPNKEEGFRNRCMELLAYLSPKEDVYAFLSDWSRIPPYISPFDDQAPPNGEEVVHLDAVEIVLLSVADFRKRQPANDAQVEFLENGCMILASLLTYSVAAVQAFLDVQGIEFVVRCLKERTYAGALALKWLDMAGSDVVYRRACEHMVEVGALKYIFPLYMGQNLPKFHTKATTAKQKKDKREFLNAIESTTIRVLYSLIRHLHDDSPNEAKDRVLTKFIDGADANRAKVNRLVDLLLSYDQRARLAEYKFFRSDVEETLLAVGHQDESVIALAALEAKLAAGGDILHRLAAIAAFCCAGSHQCHQDILASLQAKGSGIGLVHTALQEFVVELDNESEQKAQIESYLELI
jgi:beta-catenin-like protein 1